MALMACTCLNIRIHGKGPVLRLQDTNYPHLTESTAAEPFFSPNSLLITLDLGGVTRSQKTLCKDRTFDGWTITTCTCCALDIYAQFAEDHNRVIVSSNAEEKSEVISSLMESPRYSRLFKLVLPEINDNFIQNNIGIELRNSSLDASIEQVQNQVSSYLRDEQRAMEERIRKFTEAQQSNYADLLQKVRKHKQAMVYLFLKSKDNDATNKNEVVVESLLSSPPAPVIKDTTNESSTSTDSAFDRSEESELSQDRAKKQNVRSLRRTMSNPARSIKIKKRSRPSPANIDVGGVFAMEDFDSRDEFSEEEYEDSDDSSNVDDSVPVPDKPKERLMCASSLPVSIPAFAHFPRYPAVEDDDDDYEAPAPKDPEQIAASMRALACSVRDGTEIFGELPRRRLNTGELLSSRPL